jgi:hypothetical protein
MKSVRFQASFSKAGGKGLQWVPDTLLATLPTGPNANAAGPQSIRSTVTAPQVELTCHRMVPSLTQTER